MRGCAAGRAASDARLTPRSRAATGALRIAAALLVFRLVTPAAAMADDAAGPRPARATATALWPSPDDSLASPLGGPAGVALGRDGALWVAEAERDRVTRLLPHEAGASPPQPALARPHGLAATPDGSLLVADTGHHRVVRLAPDGRLLEAYGGPGSAPGRFDRPTGIAVDAAGRILVADTGNHRIQLLSPAGTPLQTLGRFGTGPGELVEPTGVAPGPEGAVLVADTGNHRVQLFGAGGQVLAVVGRPGRDPGGLLRPSAVTLAPDGSLWIADTGNHRLVRADRAGRLLATVGTLGHRPGELQEPSALAVGPAGELYVADRANRRVQRLIVTPAAMAAAEGRSLAAAGRPDLARAAFERALAANPEDPEVLAALGRVELAQGDAAGAVERAGQALRVRPDDPAFHLLFARALVARHAGPLALAVVIAAVAAASVVLRWAAVRGLRERAARHLAAGRAAESLRTYERVLALAPRDLRALRAAAALYEAAGRREAARSAHARVLRLEPENLPALECLADQALVDGRYPEAARLFARAVAADPDRPVTQASLGAALAEMGDGAGGVVAFSRALALLAEGEPPALERALTSLESRLPRPPSAAASARAFARARRAAAEEAFARAEAALTRGEPEAALRELARAACLEPSGGEGRSTTAVAAARGQAAFEAGLAAYRVRDYVRAIEFFEAALAFVPTDDCAARHLRYARQCRDGSFSSRVQHLEQS